MTDRARSWISVDDEEGRHVAAAEIEVVDPSEVRASLHVEPGHLHVLAGADLRGVEDGVDQTLPGAYRQVAGLDMQRGPDLRWGHDLDVGGGHMPPILVVNGNPGPGTFGHR